MKDDLETQLVNVMEQAAISGLCRDGQLEIVVHEAQAIYPDLSNSELLRLAEKIYKLSQENF